MNDSSPTAAGPGPASAPAKGRKLGPPAFAISLMTLSGGACWLLYGGERVMAIAESNIAVLGEVMPRMVLGVLLFGLLTVLIPRDWVARNMGRDAGMKALVIATLAGSVAPGGPWVAYPLAVMLLRFGAEIGAVVAFLASWGLLNMNRWLVWEVSFLGEELASYRILAALPLPIVAGLLVRWLLPETSWPRVQRD